MSTREQPNASPRRRLEVALARHAQSEGPPTVAELRAAARDCGMDVERLFDGDAVAYEVSVDRSEAGLPQDEQPSVEHVVTYVAGECVPDWANVRREPGTGQWRLHPTAWRGVPTRVPAEATADPEWFRSEGALRLYVHPHDAE